MNSFTEENYLKAIYRLSDQNQEFVSTNAIAAEMETKASSVTDMVKKLSTKNLVDYVRYQGVKLTEEGRNTAVYIVRKHRLWEVFLVDKLGFKWDAVHEIAEQLEHIKSPELIQNLDKFLGFPQYDPHGDPIPDKDGNIKYRNESMLSELKVGEKGVVVGVKDSSSSFLKYLEKVGLVLGTPVKLMDKIEFDSSILVLLNEGDKELTLSEKVGENLKIKIG